MKSSRAQPTIQKILKRWGACFFFSMLLVYGIPTDSLSYLNPFPVVPAAHAEIIPVPSPIAAKDVPSLVNSIIKGVLGVVGALTLLMFVYGGMLWLTSMGNSERIKKGRDTLLWAAIGLLVIFMSYAILNAVIKALTR